MEMVKKLILNECTKAQLVEELNSRKNNNISYIKLLNLTNQEIKKGLAYKNKVERERKLNILLFGPIGSYGRICSK